MTARQKEAANQQKAQLRLDADCLCVICGEYLPYDLFDLGHRVSKSKARVETYGKDVMFHPLIMLPVCHGTRAGKSCNDSSNLGNRPVEARALIDRIIRVVTGVEPMPNMKDEYRTLREAFKERDDGPGN